MKLTLIRPAAFMMGFLILLSLSPSFDAAADTSGSMTSPASRALADSNTAGDILTAGDNKVLVMQGSALAARVFSKRFASEPSIVSGGMLNRNRSQSSTTVARVCSQTQTIAISLSQDGRVSFDERDLEQDLALKGPRELRCAVDPQSGRWIAVNLTSGKGLLFSAATDAKKFISRFTLPKISANWSHVIALADVFVALSTNGQATMISFEGSHQPIRAPWSELDPHDTLAARQSVVLRTGRGQTSFIRFQKESPTLWMNETKLNIAPCSEVGGCGAWISEDQQWIVSGIWGTYIGRESDVFRLKVPSVFSESTTPGVALIPALQKFILIGDIDSELASLPSRLKAPSNSDSSAGISSESQRRRPHRFAVWLKGTVSDLEAQFPSSDLKPRPLMSYKPSTSKDAPVGEIIIIEGRIPERLPSHWAAVEPEIEFDPLVVANEWIPSRSMGLAKVVDSQTPAWWPEAIGFKQALAELREAAVQPKQIQVAVIDSGVDLAHPALKNVFFRNEKEIPNNGIDDDQNGLIDDDVGYNFVDENSSPDDAFGHGTHVAGLLNNMWSQQGTLGGAFNARLRILKALDAKGRSNSIDLARAIAAAIQGQADIMNCSWGGGPETQILRDAFAAARENNILIFSSAGNDGLNSDQFPQIPKKFPGVSVIGAATAAKKRARFSNWGKSSVTLFAPGADIYSTLPKGQFGEKSGTSMASPIAASIASLVLGTVRSLQPDWSPSQQAREVLEILCESADKDLLAAPHSKCGFLNGASSVRTTLGKGS
jgi:subtilisin family serine protease